jgi:hypothetical protein
VCGTSGGAVAQFWFAGAGVGGYVLTTTEASICAVPATLKTCLPAGRLRANKGGVVPARQRSSEHAAPRRLTTGSPVPSIVDAKIRTSRGEPSVNAYVSSPVFPASQLEARFFAGSTSETVNGVSSGTALGAAQVSFVGFAEAGGMSTFTSTADSACVVMTA